MDDKHRELRAALREMSPRRARALVEGFELPPYEAICILECEVNGKSCIELAAQLHVSPEFVKRARRRAFGKMVDEWATDF